jgi:hypothetical protein
LKARNSVDINQNTFKFDQITNFNGFFLVAGIFVYLDQFLKTRSQPSTRF